jgi:arylsulfatase A-like enzyme
MPHVPLYASQRFAGTSQRGLYGDVVETIDWGVGQIMKTLRETGVDKNTVVFFTSDNGPWLIKGDHGGSAGLLRGGKGSTWEGGMREPAIAWGPGIVRTGAVTSAMASTMDLYTTCIRLASAELPQDREIDGVDLMPILRASHKSTSGSPPQEPRDSFVYYRGTDAMAVRKGPWKMHLRSQAGYGQQKPDVHDPPLLYHLGVDPSEKHDLGDKNPDVIAQLRAVLEAHQSTLNPLPAQY